MKKGILVINAGSSSLKFTVYSQTPEQKLNYELGGQFEGIGVNPHFIVHDQNKKTLAEKTWDNTEKVCHEFLLKFLLQWLKDNLTDVEVAAAGHRIVHGGMKFTQPTLLNDEVIAHLETLIPLAPLHQPHHLTAIKALKKVFPALPQIACFDTSFHRTNPEIFQHFFIPRELDQEGVRRYGFHGLSYEYISHFLSSQFPESAHKKIAILHLGSGASACIIENGKSISTSMGLTALDGLPMGTRPGQLDAGVVLYLMQQKQYSAKEIETILYKKSGLLGLSGISNDMRILESSTDPRAIETVEAFAWKIAQMVASLATLTQGLDGVVFTAGIGEHSPILRDKVIQKLHWLGGSLNSEANHKGELIISSSESRFPIWVIPTNEELMIAQQVLKKITCQ